ncbi:hypothetical protein LX36DRAFT_347074 [Colletotrichum falcatum]|nr:hypothetical protein LX36DRAFT_347074 [Colletotrichum falcatum]
MKRSVNRNGWPIDGRLGFAFTTVLLRLKVPAFLCSQLQTVQIGLAIGWKGQGVVQASVGTTYPLVSTLPSTRTSCTPPARPPLLRLHS